MADYLDVAPGYERAVEACLGDVLQYVVVPSHDEAARGLAFVRERQRRPLRVRRRRRRRRAGRAPAPTLRRRA